MCKMSSVVVWDCNCGMALASCYASHHWALSSADIKCQVLLFETVHVRQFVVYQAGLTTMRGEVFQGGTCWYMYVFTVSKWIQNSTLLSLPHSIASVLCAQSYSQSHSHVAAVIMFVTSVVNASWRMAIWSVPHVAVTTSSYGLLASTTTCSKRFMTSRFAVSTTRQDVSG